jgi:hypothetical protein
VGATASFREGEIRFVWLLRRIAVWTIAWTSIPASASAAVTGLTPESSRFAIFGFLPAPGRRPPRTDFDSFDSFGNDLSAISVGLISLNSVQWVFNALATLLVFSYLHLTAGYHNRRSPLNPRFLASVEMIAILIPLPSKVDSAFSRRFVNTSLVNWRPLVGIEDLRAYDSAHYPNGLKFRARTF